MMIHARDIVSKEMEGLEHSYRKKKEKRTKRKKEDRKREKKKLFPPFTPYLIIAETTPLSHDRFLSCSLSFYPRSFFF